MWESIGIPTMYLAMTIPLVTNRGPSSLHPQCPSAVCRRLKNSHPFSTASRAQVARGRAGSSYGRPSQYFSRKLCGRFLASSSDSRYSHMCRPLSTLSRHRDRSVPNSLAALVSENSALPMTVPGMLLSVAIVKGKSSVTTNVGLMSRTLYTEQSVPWQDCKYSVLPNSSF